MHLRSLKITAVAALVCTVAAERGRRRDDHGDDDHLSEVEHDDDFPTAWSSAWASLRPTGTGSMAGFPTGFPSGFPTERPSGFPTGFPTGFPSGTRSSPASASTGASAGTGGTVTGAKVVSKSVGDSVSYSVNIPEAGSSDLYFQISAPSSMAWVALGQGTQMKGANMFIIYSNAAGSNVTLSPRLGAGEVEPKTASTSSLKLLAGSGISGGIMKANVLCSSCTSWTGGTMDFTSASAPFIYGYKSGASLATDSTTASLAQHDKFGTLSFDLSSATGGSNPNPFLAVSAANSNSGLSDGVSASVDDMQERILPQAHGTLGSLSFVILFPLGAIVLRVLSFRGVVWAHVAIQMLSYILAIAVLGTGVFLATMEQRLVTAHPIIGIIVIAALFFQPSLGFAHHMMFKKTGGPNMFTKPHIIWGRLWITLGIINGGLGLQLSQAGKRITIAYSVVSAFMWIAWMASALFAAKKNAATNVNEGKVWQRRDIRRNMRTGGGERLDGDDAIPMQEDFAPGEYRGGYRGNGL